MTVSARSLASGRAWLEAHGPSAWLLPHGDADGLASGAILSRMVTGGVAHLDAYDDAAFSVGTAPWPTGASLVVVDQGVRPLPSGSGAVLWVDHHAAPEPVEGTVVHDPGTGACALLAWRLCGEPEADRWLAGLGVAGDLGQRAVRETVGIGPATAFGRLASLATAPSRLRGGPVDIAFSLLTDADGVKEALADGRAATLGEVRDAVAAYRAEAGRVAPRVGPAAALVVLDVPARVHGIVAAQWSRRLSPRPVVVANRGWRTGRVSFSVRCGVPADLRAWLRSVWEPTPGDDDYGRGHAQATGGSLHPEAFDAFARAVVETEIAPADLVA